MTIYSTIDMLVDAVNNGDESALLILSDVMEEGGDLKTAQGLRLAANFKPHNCTWRASKRGELGGDVIPRQYYHCMAHMMGVGNLKGGGACGLYDTFRSVTTEKGDTMQFQLLCDAYLALADAIMETTK